LFRGEDAHNIPEKRRDRKMEKGKRPDPNRKEKALEKKREAMKRESYDSLQGKFLNALETQRGKGTRKLTGKND